MCIRDRLYTAQDPAADAPTVADGMADSASLWHAVQTLCEVRKAHPALQADGGMEDVYKRQRSSRASGRRWPPSGWG